MALLWGAFWLPMAGAQAPAAPAPDMLRGMASEMRAWTAGWLKVGSDVALDASLRSAVDDLAREHLDRLQPLFEQWIVAEHASSTPPPRPGLIARRMWARLMNEVALWRLQSPGRDYDDAMTESITRPGICRLIDGTGDFASQIVRIQAMPAGQRRAVLAGERELLARWGLPRTDLPARPAKPLQDIEDEVIAQLKAGQTVDAPAMPPILASRMLAQKAPRPLGGLSCALHQWGFGLALMQKGSDRAAALASYRYATMPLAADWLNYPTGVDAESAQPSDYPTVARAYDVQGSVTVELTIDGEGRFKSAFVTDRVLTVPGIVGVRPVAFETVLDGATIALAAKARYDKPEPAKLRNGVLVARREFAWSLK